MNKIQHLYACHSRGLRFFVEPLVFVAAAEHQRSASWSKMYGAEREEEEETKKLAATDR
jgi:threonine aldolase